jgi:vacuolar-type H+-ATPase subunit E/Vma4
MSIGTFIDEIENNKKKKLKDLGDRLSREKTAMQGKAELAIKEAQKHFSMEAEIRSQQEATRIIEAAKLQAKKVIFDVMNTKMDSIFLDIRKELGNYAETQKYERTVEKMLITAQTNLGKNIGIECREKDRPILNNSGVNITKTIQSLGGLIAVSLDGTRELDLTFEELLRVHEDEIRAMIVEAIS